MALVQLTPTGPEACGDGDDQCAHAEVVVQFDGLIGGFDIVLPDDVHYTAVAQVN